MTKCPNCGHDFEWQIKDASTPLDYDLIHRSKLVYQQWYRLANYSWVDAITWFIFFLITELVTSLFIPLSSYFLRILLFLNAFTLFYTLGNCFIFYKARKNLPHLEKRLSLSGYDLDELRDVPIFGKVKVPEYGEEYLGQPQ